MSLPLIRPLPILALLLACAPAQASTCYGTPADGHLEDGVSLPLSGKNYQAYSVAGWTLRRTFVHDKVRDVLVHSWRALEAASPTSIFVYGETGWPGGGRIEPHKTHRNGTSVDLMVPVRRNGEPATIPANARNKFGYDLEFDNDGRLGELRIDFEAMAEHLFQLHAAAKQHGIGIARVIFEVPLQRQLWKTNRGPWLRANLTFSTRPAWVRHDEHYHVDFAVSCKPLQ